MLSYEEIMNYCSNYRVENGNVFDKNTNQQILDEDIILKVKSSILLFKESKESYQSDIQQFGKVSKSQEDYIRKTMEKFSVHNEQSSFGINKLVNAILNSNGHYEEFMSGNDLQNSKFSILVSPKNEYGLAFLKLKFREKGLDIEDLKVSQDLSELQHNGVSKLIIDFKVKKYENVVQSNQENVVQSNIQHPRSQELNELERQKQIAKQNNDEVAYNYAKSSIEKIIRESRLEVLPEQWDYMSIQDQIAFVKIKMNEAKILHDQDDYNYWNSNLNSLNEKVQTSEKKTENISDEKKSSLEDLKNIIGNTEGYVVLIHGTNMTNDEVKNMIFKEGLRTTKFDEATTLDKTTTPFDISRYTSEEIKNVFENYDHNNKNMVVIKLPLEYFNIYDNTADLDCRKSRAFMKDKIYIDGRYKYLLDPKFIVGSYNTETMETMLNPAFERKLTVETKNELREKLIKLQKEIGIDPDLIEQINSDEINDVQESSYNSVPTSSSNNNNYQEMSQELETKKDYNYYFEEMLKATQQYNLNAQITEEQKKQLIGEIFYNEGYLIESLSNDEELRRIMTRSVNELSNNEMQIKLQNIILTEIQEKYKQLHPEKQVVEQHINVQNTTENKNNDRLDLSILIEQLRMELNQVKNAYRSMLSDGYIDDEELATLLGMVNKVINDGYSLKSLATDQSDLRVISVIINSLEEEQKKMNKMQNGIEEIDRSMR